MLKFPSWGPYRLNRGGSAQHQHEPANSKLVSVNHLSDGSKVGKNLALPTPHQTVSALWSSVPLAQRIICGISLFHLCTGLHTRHLSKTKAYQSVYVYRLKGASDLPAILNLWKVQILFSTKHKLVLTKKKKQSIHFKTNELGSFVQMFSFPCCKSRKTAARTCHGGQSPFFPEEQSPMRAGISKP